MSNSFILDFGFNNDILLRKRSLWGSQYSPKNVDKPKTSLYSFYMETI